MSAETPARRLALALALAGAVLLTGAPRDARADGTPPLAAPVARTASAGAGAGAGAMAGAQPQAGPAPDGEWTSVTGPTETVDANKLVVSAYAMFFVAMFGYLIIIARRQAAIAREVAELAARLERLERK